LVGLAAASDQVSERISSLMNPSEDYNLTAREGRIPVWTRGIGYMVTHPILGVGINDFGVAEGVLSGKTNEGYGIKYSAAHNSFVQIGAELGVLGLIAFVAMLWTAAAGCRRVVRIRTRGPPSTILQEQQAVAGAAEAALLAFAVGGFFLSFAYQPVTFFLVAMALGVRLGALPNQRGRSRVPRTSGHRS
jgi:O-antigen ligase